MMMDSNIFLFQGQCFIAVNPDGFAPNFESRLQEFIDTMRGLKSVRFIYDKNLVSQKFILKFIIFSVTI